MAQSFSTIATTPISGPERSPLQNAVDSDHLDRVQSLLKRDGSIGDPEVWQTQLRRAFPLVKSKEVGELLVRHGADINSKGEDGSTLLMETTIKSVIEWLIDQKVELEVKDNKGRTALRRTVQVDDDQAKAIFLIDNTNANINASDNEGRTVLMTAVWKSRVEVMDKLLSRKDPDPEVEINQLDGKGRIALHHLASDKKRNYEYKTRPGPGEQQYIDQDILEKLSNAGNEPSAKDNKGLTCLHWAAAMGCSGLLKVFLESGKFNVDVDEENYGAWTPLHHACEAPNDVAKSVEILLNHEADPNKKTRNGRTPLHLAAAAGNLEIVRTLLKHKDIKRNARDMFGNTALLSAASLKPAHPKRTAIVKLFSPWREIHSPSRSDDVERAAKLWQATIVDFRPKKDDGHHVRGIATEAKAKDKVPESQQKVVSQEQAGGEKKLSQTSVRHSWV
jgi:ankyrin repeat protein